MCRSLKKKRKEWTKNCNLKIYSVYEYKILFRVSELGEQAHFITPHAQRERGKVIDRGVHIREYGSTLYVGLARAVSPTNSNFRLTFLLTRLQEALYEDLAV